MLLILQVTHERNWKSHPNIANSDDNRGCDNDMVYTVPFEKIGSSFSHWITNIAVTTVTVSTVGILVVGVAIYFPTCLCVRGWKLFCERIRSRSQCPEQNRTTNLNSNLLILQNTAILQKQRMAFPTHESLQKLLH